MCWSFMGDLVNLGDGRLEVVDDLLWRSDDHIIDVQDDEDCSLLGMLDEQTWVHGRVHETHRK